ncbi:MAG: hypothetical protein K6G40_06940 [Eubacterium sp.]|nr:hypothetical protein [Eubacterium sp.]
MMINYFLPEFYGNFKLITNLHDLMEKCPDYFYDDIKIVAAYGCFPGNIWNGGRVIVGFAGKEDIEFAIKEYNDRGIALRFTFTNPVLEKFHVLDTYCNLCMRLAHNGKNEVLVNSPVLEEFLRMNYPDYKYISSTTKCLNDVELIKEELEKDYSLVVLDSAMNNTEELFNLPHKEKIELIANHYCADNCSRRKNHYDAVGHAQLEYSRMEFGPCVNITRSFKEIQKNRSFISTEDIFGKYKNAGFVNFKLDGRGFKREKVVESFLYYFVRPECRDEVKEKLG